MSSDRSGESSEDDPFAFLGLSRGATADEIRAARRRLAKQMHPDAGGRAASMRALNAATTEALQRCAARQSPAENGPSAQPSSTSAAPADRPASADSDATDRRRISRVATDVPSFTVEALPAEVYEALVIVTAALGEVLDDDPPYRLDAFLAPPHDCWCRLDLVPEAGASSVSLTVGTFDDRVPPDVDAVRDAWIEELNALDWPDT